MLASQLRHKRIYILRLGPNARYQDVALRSIVLAAPRTIVVIANPIIGNGINLRVLRRQLRIKSVDRRMCSRRLNRTLAKPGVQVAGFFIAQPFVRIPNSKVVAHSGSCVDAVSATTKSSAKENGKLRLA